MITVNDLIKTEPNDDSIERILWIDEPDDAVFTIYIFSKNALPVMKKFSELRKKIELGSITKVAGDPWRRTGKDDQIDARKKEMRNKAYAIVTSIAGSDHEGDIYYRDSRGKLVKKAVVDFGISKVMIYKYLRRYWQRGKTKNALLPDYDNSGGRGKLKTAGVKKRGRPRLNISDDSPGINVNEDIRQTFQAAMNKYYHNGQAVSLKEVYDFMIRDYYGKEYSSENLPTYTQFKYWCGKEQDIGKTARPRRLVKINRATTTPPGTGRKEKQFDLYIRQGFEAKTQGNPDLAVINFQAALELGPPPDLEYLFVIDIFTILKETGQYQRAHGILAQFENRSSSTLSESIAGEIKSNLKYLEILQETLVTAGTPNLPFSMVPSLIKVSVDQKIARWKSSMGQALS